MNEMYVISVLMLYTLIILINTYRLLTITEMVEEKEFIYPKSSIYHRIHTYVAPMILRINMKKDYVLNKKRRPPIILMAH